MGRSRSRSPRRKERRRSRSRDGEKRLDKFGRDVGNRNDRRTDFSKIYERSSNNASREEYGYHKKDEYKKDRYDEGNSRYESSSGRFGDRSNQRPPPPPPLTEDMYRGGNPAEYHERNAADSEYAQRQQFKEMFEEREAGIDDETRKMQQLMGFGDFNTTKNKKQAGNPSGYAKINKTQKYRQYMNRRGGFNRPLDWVG